VLVLCIVYRGLLFRYGLQKSGPSHLEWSGRKHSCATHKFGHESIVFNTPIAAFRLPSLRRPSVSRRSMLTALFSPHPRHLSRHSTRLAPQASGVPFGAEPP
jgi:hypothetical protein